MKISDMAIDRRTTVYVLLVLIFVSGLYSYWVLPREDNPEVIIPIILVTTTYEGVAPADMESLVTVPIERKLTGLSGVKQIESTSAEGFSLIQIEFEADEDIDDAHQRVRDKIDQAKPDLPPEAEDPTTDEINVSEVPILLLSLTGDAGLPILTQIAEDLEDELETIRGVLDVKVVGGTEREIQIIVDPDRAAEYGVSMANLVMLARVENVNTPAGSLELGEAKFVVRVPGEFTSADEIGDLVVNASEDGVVYLRDIAEVRDGFKDMETMSRLDGRQAVTLTLSKRAGENVIILSDTVHKMVDQFKEDRLLPGMDIAITMDTSEDIRDMVSELENGILTGLILVLVVIFIFLGLFNSFMVALAIPISMLITFTTLYLTDTTLNMVVLFSLIMALGMLVDNGIVVVENIYRHVQEGMSPIPAAKAGASEVAWPIIASTITTVAAFSPMFFWPGIWGSFMFYLPQTVCTALVASLFVGLIVNPAVAATVLRFRAKKAQESARKRHRFLEAYASVLRLALRWRMVTVFLAFASLVTITWVFSMVATVEFIPETEPRQARIDVDCAEGTRLDITNGIIEQLEDMASEHEAGLEYLIANVGSRGISLFDVSGGGNSHIGRLTLDFPKLGTNEIMPNTVVNAMRGRLDEVTGAELRISLFQHGPTEDPPVNVEISGDDFDMLAELADKITKHIEGVANLVDLRDDYEKGKPEIQVKVDRQQALLLGLNTEFIGQTVLAAINGRNAGDYREGDEEYDVTVRFPKAFREDLTNLESLTLVNLRGDAVPFSSVARIEQGAGLGSITRIDRKRTVTVSGETDGGRSGAEVLKSVKEVMADFPMPRGYSLSYTGQNEDQEESQAFLGRAYIVALFLIAIVLITQFNSIVQPIIIMSSVILSLAGVFLGLLITGMPFSVIMTGIGCLSLAGVVVNNAIVLIDFINQLRKRGIPSDEAIVQAGVTRFRPVMLTAVTTILGLIPMAVGVTFDFRNWTWIVGGESSQWWGPMAVAVIFGLAFATLLTLIVVPTLYSIGVSFERLTGGPEVQRAASDAAKTAV